MKENFRIKKFRRDIKIKLKMEDGIYFWKADTFQLLARCKKITEEYMDMHIKITLRQLYYDLVSANVIPNHDTVYKKISSLLTDARYCGLINWDAIEDRNRPTSMPSQWKNVNSLMESAIVSYRLPRWSDQKYHIELFCLDGATPVITKNGIKEIKSVCKGDEVLTHNCRFKEVKENFKQKYTGTMYKIKVHYIPEIICNDKHPFLAIKTKQCKWKEDVICKKTCYRRDECKTKYFEDYKEEWISAKFLEKGDMVAIPRYQKVCNKENINIDAYKIPVNADFMRVIGYYLSEGSIRYDNRSIKFTFNSKKRGYINFVKHYFKKYFNLETSLYQVNANASATDVIVYNKKLSDYFKNEFGNGAYNKKIPFWMLELPLVKQKSLVEALIDGDGHRTKTTVKFSSVSPTLAYQYKLLLDRFGIISNMTRESKDTNLLANFDCYNILFTKNPKYTLGYTDDKYIFTPIRSIEQIEFDGDIYNLNVEDDNSYSIGIVSHNTEKDALSSIVEPICKKWHIRFNVNKGYSSASIMYRLSKRLAEKIVEGKEVILLYLGDHDPSGLDMIRDIRERTIEFLEEGDEYYDSSKFHIVPIALTMEQINELNPPPNPAKITDPRAKWYIAKFGRVSWEVEALKPHYLINLIETTIRDYIDIEKYNVWLEREKKEKDEIRKFAKKYKEKKE